MAAVTVMPQHATQRRPSLLLLLVACSLALFISVPVFSSYSGWHCSGKAPAAQHGSVGEMRMDSWGCSLNGLSHAERLSISWHTARNFSMLKYTRPDYVSDTSPTGDRFFEENSVNYTVNVLKRINESSTVRDPWFLDIGANLGIYSLSVAAAGFGVASFEAFPPTAARLQCSRMLNGFQHMEVIHTALGQRSGAKVCLSNNEEGVFANFGGIGAKETVQGAGGCRGNATEAVVALTMLDDYFDGRWAGRPGPAVVKIDCEGCELAALLGYVRWFPVHKPLLVLAELIPQYLARNNHTTHQVAQLIMNTAPGYRMFSVDYSVEINASQVADAAQNTDLSPECSYNVAFVRKDVAGSIVPLFNPGGCIP